MEAGVHLPGRDFVRRHHVHYDVRDELVVDGEQRRKIGYRIRLWGVVPEQGLLPADVMESPFTQELLALAEQVLPRERHETAVSIEPPAPALYDSRVVTGADEIALDIRLVHDGMGDVPSGAAEERCLRAIRRALEKAGLTVDDVETVNAHATSTPEGDPRELEAIRTLFGARAGQVSVTANKSMLGHTLGAAGAIEAIATIESLRHGLVPPTINLDNPDDAAAGLDLTPNVARRREMNVAVSNSFGFGGQNSALVIRRWAE
jgi:3-oxoacyl-(acyl-carrier-protein) synthase